MRVLFGQNRQVRLFIARDMSSRAPREFSVAAGQTDIFARRK